MSIISLIFDILSYFSDGVEFFGYSRKAYNAALEAGIIHKKSKLTLFGVSAVEKFTYDFAESKAKEIAKRIRKDHFTPSIIIGIGRGGAIFGSLISYNLKNVPILMLERKYTWVAKKRVDGMPFEITLPEEYLDDILIVAGEAHTGKTMKMFVNFFKNQGAQNVKTCVFFDQKDANEGPSTIGLDYIGVEKEDQPLMPWQNDDFIRDSLSAKISSNFHQQKFFIVRHGQTQQNAQDVFIGKTEAKLNREGEEQACEAGRIIASNLTSSSVQIYSSPQERCLQTARIIAQQLRLKHLKVNEVVGLEERNFGDWEGMSREEIRARYPDIYDQYENDPLHCVLPGDAERIQSVIKRAEECKNAVLEDTADNIIIVTHKTIGRLLLCSLTGRPYSDYRTLVFGNGNPVIIESKVSYEEKAAEGN